MCSCQNCSMLITVIRSYCRIDITSCLVKITCITIIISKSNRNNPHHTLKSMAYKTPLYIHNRISMCRNNDSKITMTMSLGLVFTSRLFQMRCKTVTWALTHPIWWWQRESIKLLVVSVMLHRYSWWVGWWF